MSLKVQVVTPESIRAAAAQLRAVDKKLPGELRKLLRRVAQPIMKEQRKNIRQMPVKGDKGTRGLRRNIARGVRLKLRTTRHPAMRIETHTPFPDERNEGGMLPRGLDTFFKGFKAPLYGQSGPMYHHSGNGPSWFMGPPSREQDNAEKQIRKLLAMSAEEIRVAAAKAATRRRK